MKTISEYENDHDDEASTGESTPDVGAGGVDTKRNQVVARVRLVVFLVLLGVAVAVSFSVYHYTKTQELDAFENHFDDQATKVVQAFKFNAERRLEALEAFSTQITSHAISSNSTFPFVTLPDFERHATHTLQLAEVVALLVLPIVTAETRQEWEVYSRANQGWLVEGLSLQQTSGGDEEALGRLQGEFEKGNIVEEGTIDPSQYEITPVIYKVKPGSTAAEYEDSNGPYTPIWQMAPAIPISVLVNFNTFSHPARVRELTSFMKYQKMLISSAADFRDEDPLTANRKAVMDLFLNRWRNGTFEYEEGPVSDAYIPIFDEYGPEKKLVSVLTAYIYWQSYFTNVLPEGQNGVVCVLSNSCGQKYTYILHGAKVSYIGQGDLHESEYEHMRVETGYGAVLNQDITDPLDAQCFYNVYIYPSSEMENDHVTNNPMIFAATLLGTFLITSLIFLTYDRLVAQRHNLVETQAVQSSAVVSSLFPEKVRDRIMASTDSKKKKDTKFLSSEASKITDDAYAVVDDSMPIADLYPECTVLFADIVGFTKWSASHTPVEVFKLLETLYATFDKIARRRKVFKVETIGDCYVAVTGLPNPQEKHAVIMAKFAAECLAEVNPVLHSLVDKLGPETTDLSMRFGLNSGPVTAGVLRGEKARFQLFGDTVNTAARMESNGQRGRIHISETTADLLKAAGFSSWVVPREGRIQAKGKGSLQTYWIGAEADFSFTAKTLETGSQGTAYGRQSSVVDEEEDRAIKAMMEHAVGRLARGAKADL